MSPREATGKSHKATQEGLGCAQKVPGGTQDEPRRTPGDCKRNLRCQSYEIDDPRGGPSATSIEIYRAERSGRVKDGVSIYS